MTDRSALLSPFSKIFTLVLLAGAVSAWHPPAGAAQPEVITPTAAFTDALALRADGLLEEASHAFQRFRERHPSHVLASTALFYQGEIALQIGTEDQAVRYFNEFQRLYPAHPLAFEAQVALGDHFYDAGDYERASRVLEEVLAQRPPADLAAQALYRMGEASVQSGDYDEAVAYFRRAAEGYRETSTAPVALYAIGFTQMRRDRYDEAARAFELLTARHPNSPYARIVGIALGEVYYETGDYQRAIREFEERMPSLGPDAAERATFLIAESYNQLRDTENAIIYYRRFTEGNTDSPFYHRALYGLAWNYHFEGIYEWAEEHFGLAAEASDEDFAARAKYYQAVNQKLNREEQRSIETLRDFLFRWPNHELAPNAQLELGVTLYGQRQWREAHEAFEEVARAYPESEVVGEALYYRGNTAIALGDFEEAFALFDEAVAQGNAPEELTEEVRFQRAWLTYRTGDYGEAATAFMRHYENFPRGDRGGDALFWAAESHYQVGRHNRAEELFRRYLREYSSGPHVEAAHYALGWTAFRQGRYQDAANSFTRFLRNYRGSDEAVPYRADAQLRLGDSFYALRRYQDAIGAYAQAVEEGSEYAMYQTAQAHYNSGNPGRAVATLRRLIADFEDGEWVEEALYSIGYVQFQNEMYDEAIDTYRQLIQAHPGDPLAARAQYGIGDAYFNSGRLADAVAAYRVVLERYPQSPYVADAAAGMQYALSAEGDDRRMEAVIDSFAAQNPNSPVVAQLRFRQAEVKYQSGRRDEALGDFVGFTEAHRDSPQLPDAFYYIGRIHETNNALDRAATNYAHVLSINQASSNASDAAWRLGNIHLSQSRYQEALSVFRQMAQTRPNDPAVVARARYGEGVSLINLGRTPEAERLLRDIVEARGDSPDALPAMLGLARVYEETGRVSEAERLYRRVGDESRDEIGAEALYRLGAQQFRRNDMPAAIETFSRIPTLFPGYEDWVARAYLAQARAFREIGQHGDAQRIYERVEAEFRGSPFAETATREKNAL